MNNSSRKSSGCLSKFFLLIILICTGFFILGKYKDKTVQLFSAISISDVETLNFSINQNEKFPLPEKIMVKMTNDKTKEVAVTWTENNLNTSSPGLKTLTGKIDNYDKPITINANVLPHKILTKISNCTVENSLVELSLVMESKIKRVVFEVKKGNFVDKIFAIVDNGVVKSKIALPCGPGTYNITLYTSKSTDVSAYYNYYSEFKATNNDKRDIQFLLPNDYIESDSPTIITLANNIIVGCKTDMDKTKAIHDWVSKNISYDVEAYYNNDIRNYTSLETLTGKTAICNGYANLTAALNRAIGIKTKVISGTARAYNEAPVGHAWNETYIDGKWISQDTTWDAGGIDHQTQKFVKQYSTRFFNPSMDEFAKTHEKESER